MSRKRRRIVLGLAAAAAIAGAAYAASPYLAVARVARAVEARDTAAVMARIEAVPLRQSIARQIARAYLAANPQIASKSPLGGQLGTMVVGGMIDSYLAETFTPEAIASLLADGRPPGELQQNLPAGATPSFGRIRSGLALLSRAGFTGLTSFRVETDRIEDGSLDLIFGLRGTSWKLVAITLPRPWIDRLVAEFSKKAPAPG